MPPPHKPSMDSQLEAKFRADGHAVAYKRLPNKLMNKPISTIKEELKKLSTETDPTLKRTLLTRDEYITYYRCAQTIKKKCARKVNKDDHAKYVTWDLVKEKVKPIRSGADKSQKNRYVRESAEVYHALRMDYLKSRSPGTKIEPTSSVEIHRLAGLLVGYNGAELGVEGDGTVGINFSVLIEFKLTLLALSSFIQSNIAKHISSVFRKLRSKERENDATSTGNCFHWLRRFVLFLFSNFLISTLLSLLLKPPLTLVIHQLPALERQVIISRHQMMTKRRTKATPNSMRTHLIFSNRKEFCSFGCAVSTQ